LNTIIGIHVKLKKVLILSLGRKGGCVEYADNIIKHFHTSKEVFLSSNRIISSLPNARYLVTYNNRLNFLLSSFTRLPFFLMEVFIGLLKGQYSALYIPYFHFWNIFVILMFRFFKVNVVNTVHDGVLHSGDGQPFEQFLNGLCIRYSNGIIFLTEYVKKITIARYGNIKNSTIIPHGILKPNNLDFTLRRYPPDDFKILFIGRVNKYKGVELLIQAFNSLQSEKPVSLTIAGKFSYNIEPNIDTSRVVIIDKYLTDNEIGTLINTSDLLVLPYLEATQSGVVTIGIAGGIPMLCTDVGGLSEQVQDNNGALFCDPTSKSIRAGILRYLNNPELYEKNSYFLSKKNQSLQWENVTTKIVEYLNKTLK
jgi:glycosyltransferase involved in cell wall biosynthesis